MGSWTDNVTTGRKRKALQRVEVPVTAEDNLLDEIADVIRNAPDSWTGEVQGYTESSGQVNVLVTYTARGANRTDVTRRFERAGVSVVSGRAKTTKLEDAEAGGDDED
jgi:hypothetical protein